MTQSYDVTQGDMTLHDINEFLCNVLYPLVHMHVVHVTEIMSTTTLFLSSIVYKDM